MRTSFLVQQRNADGHWRTVTVAVTRPVANGLAQELRRAWIGNPYSPPAAVRVVSYAELAHEIRFRIAGDLVSGSKGSPVVAGPAGDLPVELAD